MFTNKKSPHLQSQYADFSYSKSVNGFTLPLPWGTVECGDQGRSSGSRFILQAPSRSFGQWHNAFRPRLQRRVRGGLVPSELHPSSLSSPCGHRDPLFNCHIAVLPYALLRYHAASILSRMKTWCESMAYLSDSATFHAILFLRVSTHPIAHESPRASAPPTIPETLVPSLFPSVLLSSVFCPLFLRIEADFPSGFLKE